ncbi:hypothetical protein FHW02_001465 [Ochrobactrum sp. RH1CCR137]|nr:hypothetical protein [Ochrobactrum sp. RH1CCR137]MBA8855617.1 hypothetical protein [Ochrobactrum sp. RH1CCR134]
MLNIDAKDYKGTDINKGTDFLNESGYALPSS